MPRRRQHYEQAFESYLRQHRVPFISVDEARRSLLPESAALKLECDGRGSTLKSFDFVIYDEAVNYLVDVKGRKIPVQGSASKPATRSRLQTWVTEDDVRSLETWEGLFGEGFRPVFVFLYWCEAPPPDGLFVEVFEFHGRWYAPRAVGVREYAARMRVRSPKWGTVHLSTKDFDEVSRPLVSPSCG
ncbi:MAG: HYExAFE family protein [Phycisphaerales bacterium]